jgi:hypothetical protein
MVLTGVSDAAEVLSAPPERRPDYIAADMSGLSAAPEDLAPGPRPGWDVAASEGGPLVLSGSGDPVDALRALCGAHWAAGGGPARVTSDGAAAAGALRDLGLGGDDAGSATVGGADSLPGADR